jgi:hypothetical protein
MKVTVFFLAIWSLVATLYTAGLNVQQEGQCKYKVTLRRFRVTIVAMENKWVLNIMGACKSCRICVVLYEYYLWSVYQRMKLAVSTGSNTV